MASAFISHSSAQKPLAREIRDALAQRGLEVWLDEADLRAGSLLRASLQKAVAARAALILLWSEQAADSRWVLAELLMGFHLDRQFLPCAVDDTPLPQFLRPRATLDLRKSRPAALERLAKALNDPAPGPIPIPRRLSALDRQTRTATEALARRQYQEMKLLLGRDHQGASRLHQENAGLMQQLEAARPLEIEVLKLAGFHRKNAYLLQHWQAIQAGRGPEDPVLLESERKFFEALLVDPSDADCLDGLASVLILERELDAAAFFETRAIRQSARNGLDYDAAWHNLKLIRQHKPSAPIPPEFGEGPGSAGAIMAASRYCEKAARHQAAGRHADALADYEHALVNDARRVEAHVGRGKALLRLQRADEALDAMAVAVRVGPDSPYAHSALAAALIEVGRLREALESADRALELAPGFPQALYYKACGYSLLEEGEEALIWLHRAIEAHPGFREQAPENPHFERLRQDPELAAGFAGLVEG